MDFQTLRAAISALYGSNAAESGRANAYLMEFTEQPVAWGLCVDLLMAEPPVDTQIQFCAANMLHTKITKHWNQLDSSQRSQMSSALIALVRKSSTAHTRGGGHDGQYQKLVTERLCISLASVAARVPEGIVTYILEAKERSGLVEDSNTGQLYAGGSGCTQESLILMLDMMRLLPGEVNDRSGSLKEYKQALLDSMKGVTTFVLKAVEYSVGEALKCISGGVHCNDLLTVAFRCLAAYAGVYTSLNDLSVKHPLLFSYILQTVNLLGGVSLGANNITTRPCTHVSTQVGTAVFDAIDELINTPPSEGISPTREASVEALLVSFMHLPSVFNYAYENGDERACTAICALIEHFAESEMNLITGVNASNHGLALVEFLLALTAHKERKYVQHVIEFWISLQETPVADRHPSLSHGIYVRLLHILLQQCEYPDGFTGWDNNDDEELDSALFEQLRDGPQGVQDVLVVICYLLRGGYFECMVQRLEQKPNSWQAFEVTLLFVTHVSKETKSWMQKGLSSKELNGDAKRCEELVQGLVRQVLINQSLSSNEFVLKTGCRLIGSFSSMAIDQNSITLADNPLLVPAIAYLREGLRHNMSQHNASQGIRSFCAQCEKWILANTQAQEGLLELAESSQTGGYSLDVNLLIFEAVTRVLVGLSDTRQASSIIVRLTAPIVQSIAHQLNNPTPNSKQLADGLQILSQVVRFLDTPLDAYGLHCASDLFITLKSMIDALIMRCKESEEVMTQVCTLVGRMLTSLKELTAMEAEIPHFLSLMSSTYASQHFSCCLDCMAIAVEVCGSKDQAAGMLESLLTHVCSETFSFVKADHPPRSIPQLIRSFYEICQRFLLFSTPTIMHSDQLTTTVELAVVCLEEQNIERESSRAVLMFITQLINKCNGNLDAYQSQVDAVGVHYGGNLCRQIIIALSRNSPSMLWPNLIDCLYAIVKEYYSTQPNTSSACQQWVARCIMDTSICTVLSTQERQHILTAMFNLGTTNRQKFKALMLDYAKVCHHEDTTDTFMAYW